MNIAHLEMTTPEQASSGVVIRNLRKTFGGVPALDDVSLDIRPGEIHGLLGENGSGKSTLIKVLAGFHDPDQGSLNVNGNDIPLPLAPGQFQQLGFAFVHQDLGLIPALSVLENLKLPYFATSNQLKVSWSELYRDAESIFARYEVDIDPHLLVSDLSPVERSLLAIIRAVESIARTGVDAKPGILLVLDEPTVYLPQREVATLFRLLRQVTAQGTGVLFVSHDLDEVLEICDRVTVLRDGRLIDTVATTELTKSQMVVLIVGHETSGQPQRPHGGAINEPAGTPAILATDVSSKTRVYVQQASGAVLDQVSFTVDTGEILGATGLAGSGFQELPYVLYGAVEIATGTISLGGKHLDLRRLRPNRAVSEGMILVPGNRQADGCVQSLSISENISLPRITRYFKNFILRYRNEWAVTQALLERFTVHPADPQLSIGNLSGGNQQKVLLAKWLQIEPQLLLLDEPTQGVDVGAREEIFKILRGEVARGASIVCASSDHEQLATICDRVLVFAKGKIVREIRGEDLTKEEITRQCLMSLPT